MGWPGGPPVFCLCRIKLELSAPSLIGEVHCQAVRLTYCEASRRAGRTLPTVPVRPPITIARQGRQTHQPCLRPRPPHRQSTIFRAGFEASVEACRAGADGALGYMIRDRDCIYGTIVTRRLRHGHSGQANCTSLTLAEWLCQTVDRIDPPPQVLGPRYCFGRGTSAPESKIIRRLLQLRENASVFGCADFSSDSSDRNHSFTPDPRRASP